MYRDKELYELTQDELKQYRELVDNTIAQLLLETNSSSPTKARDAHMRLPHWEKRRFQLNNFLNIKG